MLFALPLSLLGLIAVSPFATASPLFPSTPLLLDIDLEASKLHDYPNKIILARHGEKPSHNGVGLSRAGRKRAQCFRNVFGRHGKHNIGLILAEDYNHNTGTRARPFLTVKDLAKDLGLKVHTGCERSDAKCVRQVVKEFAKTSEKDVLICWKHSELQNIQQALGGSATTPYPDDRFDIMWILHRHRLIAKESEKCQGLDDHRRMRYPDPDLEVDGEDDQPGRLKGDTAEPYDLVIKSQFVLGR